ncbi:MAG: hypothetical protein JWN12_676 [Candidatus Saccharibacteria bacterium]|nr:hypothetical protein [Candidatus Saccharibacteria bacterium]
MFKPSPEFQKRLDKDRATDEIEAKAIKHEQRRMRTLKGISSTAIFFTFASVPVAEYAADVRHNQELQANSIITVEKYADALHPENRTHGILNIDGFGSENANVLTKYFDQAIHNVEDGVELTVGYNDAPLKYENIADKAIELANEEGITSLSIVGESGGGPIAMEVQERIREKSSIAVTAIYLLFAPNGIGGLRQDHQDQMNFIDDAKGFPGITYSTPIRLGAEVAFRSGDYTGGTFSQNTNNFFTTVHDVSNSISEQKLPGTWLMVDQALQIANADLKTRFENMKKAPAYEMRPTIVYIGTDNDPVVNNKKSSGEISDYANAAHIPYFYLNVSGVVHGQPQFNNDAYIKALGGAKTEIQDSIHAEQARASLHRITSIARPYNSAQTPQG